MLVGQCRVLLEAGHTVNVKKTEEEKEGKVAEPILTVVQQTRYSVERVRLWVSGYYYSITPRWRKFLVSSAAPVPPTSSPSRYFISLPTFRLVRPSFLQKYLTQLTCAHKK